MDDEGDPRDDRREDAEMGGSPRDRSREDPDRTPGEGVDDRPPVEPPDRDRHGPSREPSEPFAAPRADRRDTDEGSAWRAIGVAVGMGIAGPAAGVGLIFAAGLVLVLGGVDPTAIDPLAEIVLSLVLVTYVGFGGTALAYLSARDLGLAYLGVELPSLRSLGIALVGWVGALALIFVGSIVIQALGLTGAENEAASSGMDNPELLPLLVAASFLAIAPAEELLYRGIVQSRLRERFDAAPAIVGTAALFAAVHVMALSGSPSEILVTINILLLPSLVFGTIYELTGNLVVPILVHGAYNATLFGIIWLVLQYTEEAALLVPLAL